MSAAIAAIVGPNRDFTPQVELPVNNPDATRYGWSAGENLDVAYLTGSRQVGYAYIPKRVLHRFESIQVNAPNETREFAEGAQGNTTAVMRRSAFRCIEDLKMNYSDVGFGELTCLVGLSSEAVEPAYRAVLPEFTDQMNLREVRIYLTEDSLNSPNAVTHSLAVTLRNELQGLVETAWAHQQRVLEETETEMRRSAAGHPGKKRLDERDLGYYAQTDRVQLDMKQAEATKGFGVEIGAQIASALAGSQDTREVDELRALVKAQSDQIAEILAAVNSAKKKSESPESKSLKS